ncbi:hypothetical protein NE237_009560 [Protea cynaroides]|uniref:Uncharacterized protein n=1 Tax=Protea cynaroides TaxID=273540 RepID=A0A9Q0R0V5_9MAGN|nr:hypothetical protein NE237_009560 [Protea cynaroides]
MNISAPLTPLIPMDGGGNPLSESALGGLPSMSAGLDASPSLLAEPGGGGDEFPPLVSSPHRKAKLNLDVRNAWKNPSSPATRPQLRYNLRFIPPSTRDNSLVGICSKSAVAESDGAQTQLEKSSLENLSKEKKKDNPVENQEGRPVLEKLDNASGKGIEQGWCPVRVRKKRSTGFRAQTPTRPGPCLGRSDGGSSDEAQVLEGHWVVPVLPEKDQILETLKSYPPLVRM